MPVKIDDYSTAGAGELAAALAGRTVSAVELCDVAIERIERLDGAINAVVVRDFDRAREAARGADAALARGERGTLLGVPMTVKEAFNVAGLPTTWGMAQFKDWIAPADATGVARLKAAGAVILGKTNVPPHLSDWQSVNPLYGRTNHPLDHGRTPGGSSGGSAAALASGMVPLEFGSDIGGSIRVPAAFCGLFGHKPSWGLVPDRGHAPPGTDGVGPPLNVVGPISRSAADLGLALDVLAGPDDGDEAGYRLDLPAARHATLADFRVLVLEEHPVAAVDPEIRAAVSDLAGRLEAAGARVSRGSDLLPDLAGSFATYSLLLGAVMSRGATFPVPAEPIGAHAWMNALDAQLTVRRRWAALFETFDVVLAPAFGVVAFPHDDAPFNDRIHMIDGVATPYGAQVAWPGMATLANLPATAVPIGRTKGGLPIGAQIIGPYLEDRTTIAFAGLVERLLGG
ncbi:MAG: amidase family protein [Caulobacteraceae bacterium]